jgi:hypothetical protein
MCLNLLLINFIIIRRYMLRYDSTHGQVQCFFFFFSSYFYIFALAEFLSFFFPQKKNKNKKTRMALNHVS